MKVLYALSQRPDSTGSGIYTSSIMKEAAAKGWTCRLLAGIPKDYIVPENLLEFDPVFVRFGTSRLPFRIPGMSDVMPYPSMPFSRMTPEHLHRYSESITNAVAEVCRKFKPDVIHSNHLWIMTSLIRKTCGHIPVVASSHGSDIRQAGKNPGLYRSIIPGCQRLDAVFALSAIQKQKIEMMYEIPAERIHVAGAGFDTTLFFSSVKPDPHPIRIVYAGKISQSKGVPYLLKAMENLRCRDWILHIAGGFSTREKHLLEPATHRYRDRLVIHGALSPEALGKLFRQAHIFVLPSMYEGFGLVLLEALACGCRLISTNFPGSHEHLGSLPAEICRIVTLPRLHHEDKPYPEDIPDFILRLAGAIDDMIDISLRKPDFLIPQVRPVLETHTWPAVFQRIERVYRLILNRFERKNTQAMGNQGGS